MFCKNCGKEVHEKAVVCIHCGCSLENIQSNDKTFITTLLLCLFLGGFGAHRFYTGHTGTAITQLILCLTIVCAPITAIWVLIDFINILVGNFKTIDGKNIAK